MSHTRVIRAVRVRVLPGVLIFRHGRAWTGGEMLELLPDDADRLVRRWAVERV
jgi:hypothetical protein